METNLDNLTKEQTTKLSEVDFSKIPTSDEFQKIKVKPKNRLYNSIMALCVTTIGICIGVTIGLVINHFA